jgi:hypothetical protein
VAILHLPSFAGGIALEGAQDTKRADEMLVCEEFDIGARGALVAASGLEDYSTMKDTVPATLARVIACGSVIGAASTVENTRAFVVGDGTFGGVARYALARVSASNAGATTTAVPLISAATPANQHAQVSLVPFSYTSAAGVEMRPVFVCIGPREHAGGPAAWPGLYVSYVDGAGVEQLEPISKFDALGTGALGEFLGGTNGKQLYFRGVGLYNGHGIGWGFDDTASTKEGPARAMFSNPTNPLKWGNDDKAASGADRAFTDSDAIPIGDVGEVIRAGYVWRGRFWFGTSRQLHYLEGRGRDSFLTDGSRGVRNSASVVGPYALKEAPDSHLYGVQSGTGLWRYDGASFEMVGKKLRDVYGHSLYYWDHLWNDPTWGGGGYPGPTNIDLVWLLPLEDERQVWVVIPYTNAAAGYGSGSDTVVLKYHVDTGGWTRQVFAGLILLAGCEIPKNAKAMRTVFVTALSGVTLRRYGHRDTLTDSPPMPARAPAMEIEWTPYGPDGKGVDRRCYLTLDWESASSLPLTLKVTRTVDGDAGTSADGLDAATNRVTVTIGTAGHASPEEGDCWLDTRGTDGNLGNGVAGTLVRRTNDYVFKRYRRGAWTLAPGAGQRGTRATIALPMFSVRGARVKLRVEQIAAAGRWSLEGLGLRPKAVQEGGAV